MKGELLVCFAVEHEAAAFRKRLTNAPHARILVTGMGSRNAERAITNALGSASHVITAGFAGALHPNLKIGDVLFEADDPEISIKLEQAGARKGSFHCSELIAVTVASKAALHASTKADAVEMESAVIRRICTRRMTRCTTIRAISDTAHEDLPLDFNRLLTRDHALSGRKLAGAIIAAPWKIPALMRLGRNSSMAATRLGDVLAAII